jgi:hypothetical protein
MSTRPPNGNHLLRLGTTLALALAASCGGNVSEDSNVSSADEFTTDSAYVHKMPFHTDAERAAIQVEADAIINAAGPHLSYFGGKVVQNAKVIQVIYGAGTYLSGVNSGTPNMGGFYTAVLNSAYIDWLTEYNTTSPVQHIARGTFGGKITITPAASRDGATISDANIKSEISAQITAGILPAPTNNTIYMVNFPKGKRITQGGSSSCVAGGFCAYHGTFKKGSQDVFYGVLPDMSAGTGCATGCGGSTLFNNQTSVASHEMIETITDAEVGLATVVGPPLAWYDPNNGEIGDICNAQQGSIAGFTVQKEWSNGSGACIVHK